jgi:hypothetical protein
MFYDEDLMWESYQYELELEYQLIQEFEENRLFEFLEKYYQSLC